MTCGAGKEREERDVGGGRVAKAEDGEAEDMVAVWRGEEGRGSLGNWKSGV